MKFAYLYPWVLEPALLDMAYLWHSICVSKIKTQYDNDIRDSLRPCGTYVNILIKFYIFIHKWRIYFIMNVMITIVIICVLFKFVWFLNTWVMYRLKIIKLFFGFPVLHPFIRVIEIHLFKKKVETYFSSYLIIGHYRIIPPHNFFSIFPYSLSLSSSLLPWS